MLYIYYSINIVLVKYSIKFLPSRYGYHCTDFMLPYELSALAYLKTHGKVNANITIIINIMLKIVNGFTLLLVLILFSSNVPYH
jgi:hypothetical protein